MSHADPAHYQPTNITFGIMPPLDETPGRRPKKGAERKLAVAARALADLEAWLAERGRRRASPDEAAPVRAELIVPPRPRTPPPSRSLVDALPPDALRAQIRDFIEYLRFNRNASAHTVRAYESDLEQFLTTTAASQKRPRPSLTRGRLHARMRSAATSASCIAPGTSRASAGRKLAAVRTFGALPAPRRA